MADLVGLALSQLNYSAEKALDTTTATYAESSYNNVSGVYAAGLIPYHGYTGMSVLQNFYFIDKIKEMLGNPILTTFEKQYNTEQPAPALNTTFSFLNGDGSLNWKMVFECSKKAEVTNENYVARLLVAARNQGLRESRIQR
jgi:hypothetical protein